MASEEKMGPSEEHIERCAEAVWDAGVSTGLFLSRQWYSVSDEYRHHCRELAKAVLAQAAPAPLLSAEDRATLEQLLEGERQATGQFLSALGIEYGPNEPSEVILARAKRVAEDARRWREMASHRSSSFAPGAWVRVRDEATTRHRGPGDRGAGNCRYAGMVGRIEPSEVDALAPELPISVRLLGFHTLRGFAADELESWTSRTDDLKQLAVCFADARERDARSAAAGREEVARQLCAALARIEAIEKAQVKQ